MRVLEEISKRDCSNPEDRVLSVLKLLGVEQMLQVRTGRTLQWQLLELGKALLNAREEDTLLKLCVVDPFGSKLPGMSWMADFEVKNGSWQQEAKYMCKWMSRLIIDEEPMYRKARSMKRLGICSETGALEVEAHVCAGSLIFCDHDESMQAYRTKERYYKPKFHGMYTYRTLILHVDGQAVFHLCAYVSEKSTCFLQAVDKYESDAGSYIAFPAPDVHALQQIPVSLVHILNFARQKFLLVCTGDQQSGLHKIGYMVSFRSSWFELNSKLTCCKIG
ncbi:hypothetical protein KP509_24G031100 [Ceratopteris richardii]|nr:hypothetical protein KP509_24G031100 [Ceratopteris richardii]